MYLQPDEFQDTVNENINGLLKKWVQEITMLTLTHT